MSRFRHRQSEASVRAADRRKREDDAPRLLERVPDLESLQLEIEERRAGSAVSESRYVRRVVLPHAPALVVVPCMDNDCADGGHELTDIVLRALALRETEFEGEDACRGYTKTRECQRVIHFVGKASYRATAS